MPDCKPKMLYLVDNRFFALLYFAYRSGMEGNRVTIKEKVAELLLRHRGEYISGEEMARHLGVSRAAVWKAVKQLESEGMCIQAATNRGYALSDAADILSPACISGYLRHPEVFAIQVEKTLDSTNRLARDQFPGDGGSPGRRDG